MFASLVRTADAQSRAKFGGAVSESNPFVGAGAGMERGLEKRKRVKCPPAHSACSAAIPVASSGGVSPHRRTRGGTPALHPPTSEPRRWRARL